MDRDDNFYDIAIGNKEDREKALDLQINITIVMLVDEMAYSVDEILLGLDRAKRILRKRK